MLKEVKFVLVQFEVAKLNVSHEKEQSLINFFVKKEVNICNPQDSSIGCFHISRCSKSLDFTINVTNDLLSQM